MKTLTSNLTDKKGRVLLNDDVITNGHIIYRFTIKDNDEVDLLSCTHGYHHNPTQEFLSGYNYIGTFETLKDAFDCD